MAAETRACRSVGVIMEVPVSVLPDGNGGFRPCPELLTEQEAILYLRIEADKNPRRTLKYYREKGLLRATNVGRHLFYRRTELERFLELQTVGNGSARAAGRS